MASVLSIFDKEPGTGLPTQVESIGRNSIDVVRPQLFFLRDQFFSADATAPWQMSAFSGFLKFPLISGYILGVHGAYLQFQKIGLSEANILKSVIDVNNHFIANQLDVEMYINYTMQQSTFKLGLDVGVIDVYRYLNEQMKTGKSQYILLAAICQLFLRYEDEETLKMNLESFIEMNGIPPRDQGTLGQIIERWITQKTYSMKFAC